MLKIVVTNSFIKIISMRLNPNNISRFFKIQKKECRVTKVSFKLKIHE